MGQGHAIKKNQKKAFLLTPLKPSIGAGFLVSWERSIDELRSERNHAKKERANTRRS